MRDLDVEDAHRSLGLRHLRLGDGDFLVGRSGTELLGLGGGCRHLRFVKRSLGLCLVERRLQQQRRPAEGVELREHGLEHRQA